MNFCVTYTNDVSEMPCLRTTREGSWFDLTLDPMENLMQLVKRRQRLVPKTNGSDLHRCDAIKDVPIVGRCIHSLFPARLHTKHVLGFPGR